MQQVLSSAGAIKEASGFGNAGRGTALPTSPTDGMEFVLVDSLTVATYSWRFMYIAGSANTDKWEFVGGSSPIIQVTANQGKSDSSYGDLATVGPAFTCPRAGQYVVTIGHSRTTGTANACYMSFAIGATAAVDANASMSQGDQRSGSMRASQITVASASTTLTAKYRMDNTTSSNWNDRWMHVLPIRVS